jgi:penicillin-binding protein 1C
MRWHTCLRRRQLLGGATTLVMLAAGLLALDRLYPPDLRRLDDLSTTVTDRSGQPLRYFLNGEGALRLPVTVEDVDPRYVELLLASEDRRFHRHAGVDPVAVGRAIADAVAAGRVTSGASTITMQVARLLEPRPRTFGAKVIEAVRALQLEYRFDKRRILSMYLTLAPFGGNVEGVRAAALTWFGREPAALTTAEAALLVALPQAPSRRRPDRDVEAARTARARVLARAMGRGLIGEAAAQEAAGEPLPARRQPLPFVAPHLAERLHRGAPGAAVIATTLDGSLQRTVEALAERRVPTLLARAGLAILVVDVRTLDVVAHVGAPRYFDEGRLGRIDMTEAVRSPGSTLKPFVYALAFGDGVAHPDSLIADVSTRFGDYAPRNFDHRFRGETTAREALQRSLNVPAVVMLDRVGPGRFVGALRRAGVTLRLPEGRAVPGLPIALGGAGVSLRELTQLYAGLARGGWVASLRRHLDEPAAAPVRLVSQAAADAVLAILAGAAPPPGLVQAADRRRRGTVAFKTGTSYGFRDAWAFGVTTTHAVGVWVGRPDGTPSPEHAGRWTAAPLLFEVLDLLPASAADIAPISKVPPLLRRLEAGGVERGPLRFADPHRLQLVFPQTGMEFDLEAGTGDDEPPPLPLAAAGGRRPLVWLVDGRPLPETGTTREAAWRPDRSGSARITVIDAEGRRDSADIVLHPPGRAVP